MYIYYPSCNFTRIFPKTAKKIREYMKTQEDVKVVGCCKKSQDVPKEGDVIVYVCMSCMRLLDEMREDVPKMSLFEFMGTRKDFEYPDYHGEKFTLQDCFRARGKHDVHESVRECLRKMNIETVEMEHNRDEEEYDGSFRLHPPYPSNMEIAPKYFSEYLPPYTTQMPEEKWRETYAEQAKKYTTDKVAGYCNTCVGGVKEVGVDIYHVAELLFK